MDFKPKNLRDMIKFIHRISEEVNSNYNNAHAQWMSKQDLYRLKWEIEQALDQCNTFEGEEEFIKSHYNKELLRKIDNTNVKKG